MNHIQNHRDCTISSLNKLQKKRISITIFSGFPFFYYYSTPICLNDDNGGKEQREFEVVKREG